MTGAPAAIFSLEMALAVKPPSNSGRIWAPVDPRAVPLALDCLTLGFFYVSEKHTF